MMMLLQTILYPAGKMISKLKFILLYSMVLNYIFNFQDYILIPFIFLLFFVVKTKITHIYPFSPMSPVLFPATNLRYVL